MAFIAARRQANEAIAREEAIARTNKQTSIRDRVASQTQQLVRQYGARRALMGGGFNRPPIYGF